MTVFTYTLEHTTTGTFSFGQTDRKFGARGQLNGSTYISIADNTHLDATSNITIVCWIYAPATTGNHIIVRKSGAYELRLQNTNQVAWFVNSKTPVTFTYTPNTWTHIGATYKSTGSGQKLYKNGVLASSDSETGAISTNTNVLNICGDGSTNLANGTK